MSGYKHRTVAEAAECRQSVCGASLADRTSQYQSVESRRGGIILHPLSETNFSSSTRAEPRSTCPSVTHA